MGLYFYYLLHMLIYKTCGSCKLTPTPPHILSGNCMANLRTSAWPIVTLLDTSLSQTIQSVIKVSDLHTRSITGCNLCDKFFLVFHFAEKNTYAGSDFSMSLSLIPPSALKALALLHEKQPFFLIWAVKKSFLHGANLSGVYTAFNPNEIYFLKNPVLSFLSWI